MYAKQYRHLRFQGLDLKSNIPWLGRSRSDLVNGRLRKHTGLMYSRLKRGWAIGRQIKWNLNVKFQYKQYIYNNIESIIQEKSARIMVSSARLLNNIPVPIFLCSISTLSTIILTFFTFTRSSVYISLNKMSFSLFQKYN